MYDREVMRKRIGRLFRLTTARKAGPAPRVWNGKFATKIESKEEEDTASKLIVADLREDDPKSWEEEMQSLACCGH